MEEKKEEEEEEEEYHRGVVGSRRPTRTGPRVAVGLVKGEEGEEELVEGVGMDHHGSDHHCRQGLNRPFS
jgi:hypothetical protein